MKLHIKVILKKKKIKKKHFSWYKGVECMQHTLRSESCLAHSVHFISLQLSHSRITFLVNSDNLYSCEAVLHISRENLLKNTFNN